MLTGSAGGTDAVLPQVYHELVLLEKLQLVPDFSPGAAVEALSKRPLRLL